MKVFIGCMEICGMINVYADELRKQGHDVTTCTNVKNRFYPDEQYGIQSTFWGDYMLGRSTNKFVNTKPNIFNRIALKLRNETTLFDDFIERKLIDTHDVFIFLWAGKYLMRKFKDLRIISSKGKKIISILVGSDVRNAEAFQQEFTIDTSKWDLGHRKPYREVNDVLRNVERYSDVILSVPDQMGLAIRPYNHFQIPMNLDRYKYHINDNEVPIVVHAPSNPAIKGTDVILSTLNKLKEEGLRFELRFIKNMDNPTLLNFLTNADILVDELIGHGPGILSLEAMASGCAVATRYYEQSPACFRPPVVSITPETIYERVKTLILDKGIRQQLAIDGRKYVEQNNNVIKVVGSLLSQLEIGSENNYDYYPDYFLKKFATKSSITVQNKQDNMEILTKWRPEEVQYHHSLKERGFI